MRGRRTLYHLALRTWMGQCLVLGLSSHYYSWRRRRLVYSRWLQGYHWCLLAGTLVLYYPYWQYAMVYFEKETFRRQDFIMQVRNAFLMMSILRNAWLLAG